MPSVWIVPWLASLGADEVQDLVFSLSRDRSIRKDDLESLPKMIILEAISDIILQRLGESVHKLSSRSDDIFIKLFTVFPQGRVSKFDLFLPFVEYFFLSRLFLFNLEGPSKSSRSLLVHLGPRSYSIDGHVHETLGLNNPHNLIDILKYVVEHLHIISRGILTRRPRARMNDSVHVEI